MTNIAPKPPERVLSTLNRDGTRYKIRPTLAKGRFLYRRAVVAYSLIAFFVLVPYFSMNGKPLVLLDLVRREFTFFGRTFLPTDSIILMFLGLSIVVAVFLLTALWGRVWCGWACPQTIYLEFIFRPIERWFEGSPSAQRKIDKKKWSPGRVLKNIAFLLLSMFVAHTFIAYFVGVEQLFQWVQGSPTEHPVGFLVMASVTALMFFDFSWFREQMCIVACPYGRLQSVLLDKSSLIVGYDELRGEPRGKLKKGEDSAALGDCVDCNACVRTCPTGIDIRKGLQMECIGCTQCIDACDAIMDRIGKDRGLIRYSSQDELAGADRKLFRPRVVIYPIILCLVFGGFIYTLTGQHDAEVTVLRQTVTPFTVVGDDKVSNPVQLKIINRTASDQRYTLKVGGADDAEFIAPQNPVPVAAGKKAVAPFFLISDRSAFKGGRRSITIQISDGAGFDETVDYELIGPAGGAK